MNNRWRVPVFSLHCEESAKIIWDFGVLTENMGMKCIFWWVSIIRSEIIENDKVPKKELILKEWCWLLMLTEELTNGAREVKYTHI